MLDRSRKRSQDASRLEKLIADLSKGAAEAVAVSKNPAAVALGRLGGQKGGKARAASLSASKRKKIAKLAAQARWSKKTPS